MFKFKRSRKRYRGIFFSLKRNNVCISNSQDFFQRATAAYIITWNGQIRSCLNLLFDFA